MYSSHLLIYHYTSVTSLYQDGLFSDIFFCFLSWFAMEYERTIFRKTKYITIFSIFRDGYVQKHSNECKSHHFSWFHKMGIFLELINPDNMWSIWKAQTHRASKYKLLKVRLLRGLDNPPSVLFYISLLESRAQFSIFD